MSLLLMSGLEMEALLIKAEIDGEDNTNHNNNNNSFSSIRNYTSPILHHRLQGVRTMHRDK